MLKEKRKNVCQVVFINLCKFNITVIFLQKCFFSGAVHDILNSAA